MNLLNETKNQHFLSQVEQRFNTCNQGSTRPYQKKIYEFEILQREPGKDATLGPAVERKIANNLALHDLFSFDVEPKAKLRQNFEELFQRHERSLYGHTEALLAKAKLKSSDIKEELIALFTAKLLNFMRNPYSVIKMLNTFRNLANFRPTDPEQNHLLQLVLEGRRPHQAILCKHLGISDLQYQQWLATLFMALTELGPEKKSLFDDIARQMFTEKEHEVVVLISTYTKEKCLLSDRSFSTNLQSTQIEAMDFNLRHDAFIRYGFANRTTFMPPNTSPEIAAFFEKREPTITVLYFEDDLTLLKGFNMNVINQSHSRVFCSIKEGIVF